MLYAEIAVDTYQDPRKKLFTYQVPDELATSARPGTQVTVPFGKRTAGGYVWQLSSRRPPFPTKPLQAVKKRVFSDKQLELARWMTATHLSSPLECLKCQLIGKGERSFRGDPEKITTLILVPYASQVKIWALKHPEALVGSRSAVFSQLPNLKKIVIEEPENWSYKDERAPYYHAKDIAQKRAEIEKLVLELRYRLPRGEDLQKEKIKPPKIKSPKIVDLSPEKLAGNFTFISQPLERLIQARKDTIVYVNSRDLREGIAKEILKTGSDRNTISIAGPELFSAVGREAEYAVWADPDTLLNLPDFRAHEKLVWTVSKLAEIAKKEIYLQTSFPQNPLFADLAQGSLENFYRRELKNRRQLGYPPFTALVKLTYSAKSRTKVYLEAQKLYEQINTSLKKIEAITVSPPYEPYIKTPRKVQLHLAIKIKPEALDAIAKLEELIPPDWKREVDPESLL